ncbi:MAG TPA: DUF4214 domain-containing protein, partial [Gemmataceae bacterium]|nr:DUF4214 domain-containing protein [Gemmataceae bacterium]
TPAQSEVDLWVSKLQNGVSPQTVAYGFAASRERESKRVRGDYQTFLGRTPTASEVTTWVQAFGNGLTNENLVAGFIASTEYFDAPAKGKSDKTDWLFSAVHDVLKRLPRTSEYNTWGGTLQ